MATVTGGVSYGLYQLAKVPCSSHRSLIRSIES